MRAYKFLDRRGSTVITGVRWPRPQDGEPGPWVEATAVRPCRAGIHACTAEHLAYWISDDLWVVELDGQITNARHKVVARRGRIIERVPAWNPGTGVEMCTWLAWRCRDLAETSLRDTGDEERASRIGSVTTLAELDVVGAAIADDLDDDDRSGMAAGYAGDVARLTHLPSFAEATFIAACAVAHAASPDGSQVAFDAAFAHERRLQSRWLAERLALA